MPGKKVLVLGGGFGGVAAARTARSMLDASHDVTLIDRNRLTHLCGANPLLIVGEREPAQTGRSLGRLANRGINFVEADIQRIDTAGRSVATSSGTFDYDYLVVALGANYAWDAVPGSREAYSFYGFDEARRLRRRLSRFRRGRIVIAVAGMPIKCPPAPFETAMVLNWAFRRRGIRSDVNIHVFIPEPAPLGVAGPAAGEQLRKDLDDRGIALHTGAAVKEVDLPGGEVMFRDGSSMRSDVIVTVPVHRLPRVVAESGMAGDKPWIPVSPATLETGTTDVFAIGDVNMVPTGEGRAIPKAGVFASGEGETVGRLITSRINGAEPPPPYDGTGQCFLAYSGTQSALVGGTFLAEGGPQVSVTRPTPSGMLRKERFEQDWRRFRI